MKSVSQAGVTLIELIIAIVVLGIASVGILTALGRTTLLNVDPLFHAQSLALAQSFMDEVTGKPFYSVEEDPTLDTDNTANPCPAFDLSSIASRQDITHVCGFDGYTSNLESGITAPNGDAINGLSDYVVTVTVAHDPASDSPPFDSAGADCILGITVEVTDPSGTAMRLTGFRTSYWEGCG